MISDRVQEGDFIIVEPGAPIQDNDWVLVKIQKGHERAHFSVRKFNILKHKAGRYIWFALRPHDPQIAPIIVYSKKDLRKMNPCRIRGFSVNFTEEIIP
jgi:hypothetical protein